MDFKKIATILILTSTVSSLKTPPNIIFILADDLGWNDVGFHGSNQIPTPNIDALAYSGIILNNYYVTPICTPSRSALMTGKYPIHTGMQHTVLFGAEPRGLPLSETILPQYLKKLGYTNRIVGKWHLGSYKKEYTPLYRGFDSHVGYWTGHHDYFDHIAMEDPGWGLDMRRGMGVAYDLTGRYSTDIFAEEATKIIDTHNKSSPLFLYVAHAAVHSGNPYNPLPCPDDYVEKFSYIENYDRRRFAGMLSKLDDSVGEIVNSLHKNGLIENSIIIFSTDNGGPAEGFNLNAASNYPLRGVKNTLWEGGVRGAGLIWSPLLQTNQIVSKQMMHISDWLPTILTATGANLSVLDDKKIDGVDLWDSLKMDKSSKRTEILHNIDDIYGSSALMVGAWKIVKGTNYKGAWDSWYGPSGRNYTYNTTNVLDSKVGRILKLLNRAPSVDEIMKLRKSATIECLNNREPVGCEPLKETCLFNLIMDPCEHRNVAKLYPLIMKNLDEVLKNYNESALPPGNLPLDPRGNPKYWNYTWTNFGDYI